MFKIYWAVRQPTIYAECVLQMWNSSGDLTRLVEIFSICVGIDGPVFDFRLVENKTCFGSWFFIFALESQSSAFDKTRKITLDAYWNILSALARLLLKPKKSFHLLDRKRRRLCQPHPTPMRPPISWSPQILAESSAELRQAPRIIGSFGGRRDLAKHHEVYKHQLLFSKLPSDNPSSSAGRGICLWQYYRGRRNLFSSKAVFMLVSLNNKHDPLSPFQGEETSTT